MYFHSIDHPWHLFYFNRLHSRFRNAFIARLWRASLSGAEREAARARGASHRDVPGARARLPAIDDGRRLRDASRRRHTDAARKTEAAARTGHSLLGRDHHSGLPLRSKYSLTSTLSFFHSSFLYAVTDIWKYTQLILMPLSIQTLMIRLMYYIDFRWKKKRSLPNRSRSKISCSFSKYAYWVSWFQNFFSTKKVETAKNSS